MLRHFKMELKRQQEREFQQLQQHNQQAQPQLQQQAQKYQSSGNLLIVQQQQQQQQQENTPSVTVRPLASADTQAINLKRKRNDSDEQEEEGEELGQAVKQVKRVRGRRSSKPAMEKRRRARINECLDILKSYVLNDTGNLSRLGIDLSASENLTLDEDSIARQILMSSGLINRHRGRKNPNKLEKADILELTVDYVRRLHEQRDELLVTAILAPQEKSRSSARQHGAHYQHDDHQHQHHQLNQQVIPAHLEEPLTLDLSPQSRLTTSLTRGCPSSTPPPTLQAAASAAAYRPPPNTPLTPPSSSSSGQNDLSSAAAYQNQVSQMELLSRALAGRSKLCEYASFSNQQQ